MSSDRDRSASDARTAEPVVIPFEAFTAYRERRTLSRRPAGVNCAVSGDEDGCDGSDPPRRAVAVELERRS